MTARNTATSWRPAKPLNHIIQALLSGIIAAAGRHRHALQKRKLAQDGRDLDQRVRECGEW
jgi:hypothetical protein